jgi:hypothetical protein
MLLPAGFNFLHPFMQRLRRAADLPRDQEVMMAYRNHPNEIVENQLSHRHKLVAR